MPNPPIFAEAKAGDRIPTTRPRKKKVRMTFFFLGSLVHQNSNLLRAKWLKLSPDACGRETPARLTRKTLCFIF